MSIVSANSGDSNVSTETVDVTVLVQGKAPFERTIDVGTTISQLAEIIDLDPEARIQAFTNGGIQVDGDFAVTADTASVSFIAALAGA